MGLFDFFRGRPSSDEEGTDEEPAARGPLPWRERLELATSEDDFDWDWGNAGAHRIVHSVLSEAAPRFGTDDRPARIKELPDDEHIDLRGTFDGAPIRFPVWMAFGSFWTIEMRVPQLAVSFDLERDHEKIPKQRDEADPFDDGAVRVFVGKGIFFEGDPADVTARLELWDQIAEPTREQIVVGMERLDVCAVYASGTSLKLNQQPGLTVLDDPPAYMEDCARFLATVRDALSPLATAPTHGSPAAPARPAIARVACAYCSSVFFQTPPHPNCPNCGAAPGA